MSDLIKRSDAIDAYNEAMSELVKWQMEEWQLGDFSECEFNTTDCKHIVRKIEAIPSADTIDAVSEWIPCSERLPEERQDVYVTVFWDDYGDTITAYGMRTQFGWLLWNTAEGELLKGYTVTAWMPLPKPYGERKGE